MSKNEYLKVGETKVVNGEVCIKPDYFDDGLTCGTIFKDEETYDNDWYAVCYVPEYGFEKENIDNEGFFQEFDGYTHNDLLELCMGNREWCDYLFHDQCKWAYPSTYIEDEDDDDTAYFYRFIKPGAKVWWNDPAGETSGEYTVWAAPFEFDERDELVESGTFGLDVVVMIGTDNSEAEVTPSELTPVYTDLKTDSE